MNRVTRHAALCSGLAVVLLWASAFAAIRVAAPQLGVAGLSFVRLVVATLALLTAARHAGVALPRARDLGSIIACGATGMTAYQLLLNEGELHVAAGPASLIVAGTPLVSTLVAWRLLGERVTRYTAAGSAVALGGVAVVCLNRDALSLSAGGAVYVVGAMVAQGIYHPLQKPLRRRYTGLATATYAMVAGTVLTAPTMFWGWRNLATADPGAWLAALYLGLLPSALGFALWAFAVGRMTIATSTALLYLVPPVAVLIAWLWLGEQPTVQDLAGGLLVLAGVATVSRSVQPSRRTLRRPGFATHPEVS